MLVFQKYCFFDLIIFEANLFWIFVVDKILFLNTRSGAEEEYGELSQLLDDILTFRMDMKEIKERDAMEKEKKKNEIEDRNAGIEMRRKAMEGLASKYTNIKWT